MWGGLLFSIFFYYLIPIITYKILAQQDYTINHWYRYHFFFWKFSISLLLKAISLWVWSCHIRVQYSCGSLIHLHASLSHFWYVMSESPINQRAQIWVGHLEGLYLAYIIQSFIKTRFVLIGYSFLPPLPTSLRNCSAECKLIVLALYFIYQK